MEAVHDAGRGAERAQHDGHGAGEVFAVAFAAVEEEVRERIGLFAGGEIERVAELRAEIAFDGGGGGELAGERGDAGIKRGEFEIALSFRKSERRDGDGAAGEGLEAGDFIAEAFHGEGGEA